MNLQQRIDLLIQLRTYMLSNERDWADAQVLAEQKNAWFIPGFIKHAVDNIANNYLQKHLLANWADSYGIPAENSAPRILGIVMAGNLPLVGFHDFLCGFIAGHKLHIKLSSKDDVLLKHLVTKMGQWNESIHQYIYFNDILKGCDAYIATGSNNSGRYFEYYFAKYPHIIRKNRTSVAVLTGKETSEQLALLADDIHLYFGLGCRNVTRLFVPANYDFIPLIDACKKYNYFFDLSKYRNNYDYQLALLLMNKIEYKSTGALLLVQNESLYSPISIVNYSFLPPGTNEPVLNHEAVQCIIGQHYLPFGQAQQPALNDYADGVDTMHFLVGL